MEDNLLLNENHNVSDYRKYNYSYPGCMTISLLIYCSVWMILFFISPIHVNFIRQMVNPLMIMATYLAFSLLCNNVYHFNKINKRKSNIGLTDKFHRDQFVLVFFVFVSISYCVISSLTNNMWSLCQNDSYQLFDHPLSTLLSILIMIQPLLWFVRYSSNITSYICFYLYFGATIALNLGIELILQNKSNSTKYYVDPNFGYWTFIIIAIQILSLLFSLIIQSKFNSKELFSYDLFKNKYWFSLLGLLLSRILILSTVIILTLQNVRINNRIFPHQPTIPPTF